MRVLLSKDLTSRFKDERSLKEYSIPEDVKHTWFDGKVFDDDSEPFKYLFVVLINGLELPTLYVYTGTGLVDTGISTESTQIAINYVDPASIAEFPAKYHHDLVVPDIPLGDKVPCNVVSSPVDFRKILDVQITSLKKNENNDGYDIVNRIVPIEQGKEYTFVYSENGMRGEAKIVKGKVKDFKTNYDRYIDKLIRTIYVDISKKYDTGIIKIEDQYLYDVQDIDYEYNDDDFAKEEISPDPKCWIDVTEPTTETIVPGGEQPRE